MRIDCHQHFWNYDPIRDSWIDNTMQVIRKDFLPINLKPILDQNGIDGCIAVQADQSELETEFLLDLANKNSFIKGIVGWVDLCDSKVESRLEHYSKNSLFKGVRHILQGENSEFMLRDDFQRGIGLLEKFNLTYDILVFFNQLEVVLELVEKFPNQSFVIDHIAKPEIKDGKIEFWKKHITKIAKYPNVYCKISGMVTEADLKEWKTADITPYLDVVFQSFGTNRIMYGSDWPVCLLAAEYKEQLQLVLNYMTRFSKEEQTLVMGVNAVKFYNIKS